MAHTARILSTPVKIIITPNNNKIIKFNLYFKMSAIILQLGYD